MRHNVCRHIQRALSYPTWGISCQRSRPFVFLGLALTFSISPKAAAPSAPTQFLSRSTRVLEQLLASASEICRTASSPTNLSDRLASADPSLSRHEISSSVMTVPQYCAGPELLGSDRLAAKQGSLCLATPPWCVALCCSTARYHFAGYIPGTLARPLTSGNQHAARTSGTPHNPRTRSPTTYYIGEELGIAACALPKPYRLDPNDDPMSTSYDYDYLCLWWTGARC